MSGSSLSAGGMCWKGQNIQVQESASVWGDIYCMDGWMVVSGVDEPEIQCPLTVVLLIYLHLYAPTQSSGSFRYWEVCVLPHSSLSGMFPSLFSFCCT